MMRSPQCFAVVVRRKNGALIVREQPWLAKWSGALVKLPFVRGAATLVESMSNGYQALSFSAEQMEEDLADDAASTDAQTTTPVPSGADDAPAAEGAYRAVKVQTKAETGSAANASRFAMVFAALFFIALPQLLASLFGRLFGPGLGFQDFGFHLLTGGFKLALVLGYMLTIRRIPEIRRVFQYHGAEHKAIATFEAGEPLEVRYAKLHSTRHARCGTTFLIVVVMVSVLVYALVLPTLLKGFSGVSAQAISMAIKLLLVPPIAGLSYELQRVGARFADHPIARIFLTPGYMVQGITTIEPSDDQLEVALASLRVTLAREAAVREGKSSAITEPVVRTYSSFDAFTEHFAIAGLKG